MNRIEIAAIVIIICLPIFPNLIPSAFAQEYDGALDITVEGYDETHDYSLCGGELHELNIGCLSDKGSEFVSAAWSFPYNGDKNVKLYGCVIDETADKFYCDSMDASPVTKIKSMTLFVGQSSKIPLPSILTESNIQNTVTEGDADNGLIPWTDPDTGLVYDIPAQGDYCLDFNGDSICDIDFTDGKVVVYEDEEASSNDNDKKQGNDCWEGTKFIGKDKCDTKGNPLCSETDGVECFDDKDYPQPDNDNDLDEDSNDNGDDCQSQDDFCDNDEGCESESVDCIDGRGFGEDDYNG
jgi:hypothetical protein